MKKILIRAFIAAIVLLEAGGCKKFLDEKSSTALYVPSTVEDLQSLLDDIQTMNQLGSGNSLIDALSDDYSITFGDWGGLEASNRNAYIWEYTSRDIINSQNWSNSYTKTIYYSNFVLDNLTKIKKSANVTESNVIQGSALFFRAFGFYGLAQIYCKPYSTTSNVDLGIVLRETAAVEAKSVRATVAATYRKIIDDLNVAVEFLPEVTSSSTRPNKSAALALLARVFLNMGDYRSALKYSNLALDKKNALLDYNKLTPANNPVLPTFANNPEVIFFSTLQATNIMNRSIAKIDSNLYKLYSTDDIRKLVFFSPNTGVNLGTYRFKGSYYTLSNGALSFNGLTTGELYLIKAECLVRNGNTLQAMTVLNELLINRFKKNSFIQVITNDATDAKKIILSERRKELIFRGLRWSDLRRLNNEGESITLTRVLNNIRYTLSPGDTRWVLPIPEDEITRSGIPQNP